MKGFDQKQVGAQTQIKLRKRHHPHRKKTLILAGEAKQRRNPGLKGFRTKGLGQTGGEILPKNGTLQRGVKKIKKILKHKNTKRKGVTLPGDQGGAKAGSQNRKTKDIARTFVPKCDQTKGGGGERNKE